MRRRALFALLGGAIAFLLASAAQQKTMPVIGYLGLMTPNPSDPATKAFHRRAGTQPHGRTEN